MTIVGSPPASTDLEELVLDGLALNDDGTFGLLEVAFPPPRQRQEWIGAADSEAQLLTRSPLHENRKVTAKVAVAPEGDMDLALGHIGALVDKLQKASQYEDGIDLTWSPASSALTCTFDVLAGEITDLPVDWQSGWLAMSPEITIELTCKPYWRGEEVLTATATSSTPIVTLEIPDVPGDIPALGRLIITDTASQSRRHVEWGLEGELTYDSGTVLLIDSDQLVTSGFAGTQATLAGSYDVGGGNNSIQSVVLDQPQAVCGTGVQAHVGAFRVKARVNSGGGGCDAYFRFAWRVGDGSYSTNDPARLTTPTQAFHELDLGTITIPVVLAGTQAWDGRVEAYSAADGQVTTLYVDYLALIPCGDGYGKARATYTYQPGAVVARDSFTGLGSGAALSARTPDAGAAWATSGVAPDFVGSTTTETTTTQPRVTRSTNVVETEARVAVLGSAMTNQQVQATAYTSAVSALVSMGAAARYVDDDNYLWLRVRKTSASRPFLELVTKIAGTPITIASVELPNKFSTMAHYFDLVVFDSGRAIGSVAIASSGGGSGVPTSGGGSGTLDVVDAVLATGGALATGRGGIADQALSTTASARKYDDVTVAVPPAEPIVLYSGQTLEVRHDDVIREDATGVYTGRPQSYRGSRFTVPVGTGRIVAKARRNDVETSADANVTDALQIQVAYTPRGVAVPRT